ncbi:adenylate/guanylate cyclase domain-containing protein [Leptospira idonii]|uniref:Adenylate/guanylate cyclase domain-containing protein n=1 Tax=Leptospira idonii TaxID=1193500 RepID=A0A4R9LUI8_9LEPT|nr:adenylate/guanylate cyclase domain-containing protein [Leptospira idonii]TGN17605.1 adenylate/guanylate cyclase domain-containing protein [Leptospira idonii]
MTKINAIYNTIQEWFRLKKITQGLTGSELRSATTTFYVQFSMSVLPTILIVSVHYNEPPETHFYSLVHYLVLIIPLMTAYLLLRRRYFNLSAIITLVSINYHLGALTLAQADDPAPIGFFITSILSFLMISKNYNVTRFLISIASLGLYTASQYYYRVMGGNALFGPPKWIVPAEYLIPPLILGSFLIVLIVYQFVKAVETAETKLTEEHEKSEKLLLNIIPQEIAEELKRKGVSTPRQFNSATICFTDFEGFTSIAETMNPKELVEELDRCFSYFDSLMDHYNLEKLKTIGDSYMFVGGIPSTNKTHAVDCVLAAIEIQAFMNQMKDIKESQNLPYWELRLGIHSGEVIAGVIGEKKFAYDVWSDTVNTASRCESSGVSGKINISSATFELVKDFFDCDYRGYIDAKNKGKIKMYFVNGILEELREKNNPNTPNSQFKKRYEFLKDHNISL